jgi:hypothetical protein
MSRSKQTFRRGRSGVVTALGIAGALSLAGGASASTGATQNTAPVILGEEEISDVSLATFYVFDKETGAHRSGVRFAAQQGGCKQGGCKQGGCGGCGSQGCGGHGGCGGAMRLLRATVLGGCGSADLPPALERRRIASRRC